MISQTQKNAIDLVISLNPTSISIVRTELVEKDGAREAKVSKVKEQTILLYPKSARMSSIGKGNTDVSGMADESDWGALAPSTADVCWGAFVTDEFTVVNIGTFEIVSGRPIMIATDLNGYQLNLRLVK